MATLFPTSPTAGQLYPLNGILYTYDSAKGWLKTSNTLDTTLIKNLADPTKSVKLDCSNVTTGTTRTITMPNKNGTMALDIEPVTIATSGNLTLDLNKQYLITSTATATSVLTLPAGTSNKDIIKFKTTVTGFNDTTNVLIKGTINGTANETYVLNKSFKITVFEWCVESGTWILGGFDSGY
jgi:VCBS repeat-containing protein